MVNKTRLAGIALGVALLLGGASTTKAAHWSESKCRSKIQKEQRELDRAVYRFGPSSRKANEERRELNRILERCEYDGYRGYRGDQLFNRNGRWPNTDRYVQPRYDGRGNYWDRH